MLNNKVYKKSYLFLLPWSLNALGGVNTVVENLFLKMKLDGKYEPIIMVNSWDDLKIRQECINGIDHIFFRLRSPWSSTNNLRNFMVFCFEFVKKSWILIKFLRNRKVAVINVHYCSLYALNIVLLKYFGFYNGLFVLSFHGKDLLNAKFSKGLEIVLWKYILNNADKIVTCSQFLKDELSEFLEISSDKIVVIHNGIDMSTIEKLSTNSSCLCVNENKYILNVATIEHIKAQDVLLKAFIEISEDFPDVSLVIIGRCGGAEQNLKQLIETYGLSQRVRLFGGLSHNQVLAFMERAVIFVLPSRFEAFGIVILEAGAFGVPVIASNVGGIREILTQNETGRLCEPEDIVTLASDLRLLLLDAEERRRLGGNLKKHVINNFSWEKTYKKYCDIVK